MAQRTMRIFARLVSENRECARSEYNVAFACITEHQSCVAQHTVSSDPTGDLGGFQRTPEGKDPGRGAGAQEL